MLQNIQIFGLYDTEDYGLDINMWTTSVGDQLKNILNKLDKLNLSTDALNVQISMLTNAYLPKNISEKILRISFKMVNKKFDLELIEEYLIKNEIFGAS